MTNEMIMGLLAGNIVMLVAVVIIVVKMRNFNNRLRAQNALCIQNQENIRALFSGAAGMGDHLVRIEYLTQRLGIRQDQLDLKDFSNHSYDHAIKLIQSGADYEEIIAQCGLVREEADLLVQMYRYDKAS